MINHILPVVGQEYKYKHRALPTKYQVIFITETSILFEEINSNRVEAICSCNKDDFFSEFEEILTDKIPAVLNEKQEVLKFLLEDKQF